MGIDWLGTGCAPCADRYGMIEGKWDILMCLPPSSPVSAFRVRLCIRNVDSELARLATVEDAIREVAGPSAGDARFDGSVLLRGSRKNRNVPAWHPNALNGRCTFPVVRGFWPVRHQGALTYDTEL